MRADASPAVPAPSEVDRAARLRLLLGLPANAPTFASRSLRPWAGGRLVDQASRARGGLALLDTADAEARAVVREPASLRQFEAALVLAATPRPGLRGALRALRRPFGPRRLRDRAVAELLTRAGHHRVVAFGFSGDAEPPEEFVPGQPAGRAGTAFLLTSRDPFAEGILRHATTDEETLSPDRIELRARGAAVILGRLASPAGSRGAVIRVVAEGPLQDVVRRNHERLAAIRVMLREDPALLLATPEPLLHQVVDGALLLVESMLPGDLAWRHASSPLERRIHENTLAFLRHFASATAAPLTPDLLAGLARADGDLLDASPFVPSDLRSFLRAELDRGYRTMSRVDTGHASHGDFGYGNILVDGASGAITGVIDWDTARLVDVPGIDRINLEIQRARMSRKGGAFDRAVADVRAAGVPADALGADSPEAARAALGLAVSRYVLRSLRYPSVFRAEVEGFRRGLEMMAAMGVTPA